MMLPFPPRLAVRRARAALLSLSLAVAGLLAVPAAPAAAAPYPSPLPNCATGHGQFNPTSGTTPRKGLVIYVTLSGTAPVAGHDGPWLARRWFGARPSVADYFRTFSGNRLTLTPLAETQGTPNDGVVTVSGGAASTFLAGGDAASGRINADALRLAAPYADFGSADRNADGRLTSDELMVSVVWAPYAPDNGGRTRGQDPVTVDAKAAQLARITMTSTEWDLMTVIHEVGHATTFMRDLYGYGVSRFALEG